MSTRPITPGGRGFEVHWQDRRALDRLARRYAMLRAGATMTRERPERWEGACQRCSRTRPLSWCHIFTRGAWSVRWDLENSWAWCKGCHRYLDQHWEEKFEWIVRRIGPERFALLKLRKQPGRSIDYAGMRLFLEQQVRKLEAA